MAGPVLHIKDSYYFEVPKMLYPYEYRSRRQFPDVWISLDPEFQKWEADRLYDELELIHAELPPKEEVLEDWQHSVHADHKNFAKPLKIFLDEKYKAHETAFAKWKNAEIAAAKALKDGSAETKRKLEFSDYIAHLESTGSPDHEYFEFLNWRHKHEESFQRAVREARDIAAWKQDPSIPEWNEVKLSDGRVKLNAYNEQLSGKILIPQPFGTLRNLYEKDEGFAISKYMVLEVAIGLLLVVIFSSLASRVSAGGGRVAISGICSNPFCSSSETRWCGPPLADTTKKSTAKVTCRSTAMPMVIRMPSMAAAAKTIHWRITVMPASTSPQPMGIRMTLRACCRCFGPSSSLSSAAICLACCPGWALPAARSR